MSWSTCTFASSMAHDYLCILYYLRLGEKEVIILMTTYGAILGRSWSPQPFMTSVTQILPVPRLVKLISWWHRLTLVLVAHKSLSLICTQNQRIEVFHNHTSCVSRGFRFLPHARRLCQWNTGREIEAFGLCLVLAFTTASPTLSFRDKFQVYFPTLLSNH